MCLARRGSSGGGHDVGLLMLVVSLLDNAVSCVFKIQILNWNPPITMNPVHIAVGLFSLEPTVAGGSGLLHV